MDRLLGLETEYGLFVEGVDVAELTAEARTLVRCGPRGARWDYREESPRRDLRGFTAARLRTNPEDDRIERRSRGPKPQTPEEEHADRVLANGARLYHDHGHPEYSTPECVTLLDLVAHDRAGGEIVRACAQSYQERTGRSATLYKNNTDYHRMSYGCHENYLTRRDLPLEQLVGGLLPFLVTRIIYTGAGKVGAEDGSPVGYQLSQRAEFFDELMGVDTLHRRPLVNTRDEPHADRRRWRRLHLILGDANLSEYATALKVGTTALVLDLLEAGHGPPGELKDPLAAIRSLSREVGGGWPVELADGSQVPAVELQRAYLGAAERLFSGRDEETDWVLSEWERALDDLEADPRRAADRIDWVAKRELLESFMEAEGLSFEDDLDLLRSLDLEYHNLDPEGLFWALERQGAVKRLTDDEAVREAACRAPHNTRAYARGFLVRRFEVTSASWGRVRFCLGGRVETLDLTGAVGGLPRGSLFGLPRDADYQDVLEWVRQLTAG